MAEAWFVVFGWFCNAYLTISKGLMQVVFGRTSSRASPLPQGSPNLWKRACPRWRT
ncbi:hypothetical protein EMIT0P100_180088 [Pseudomonas sp. IT-P100]